MKTPNYRTTIISCFIGYIIQAVINNFVPLLFLTFQSSYNIPLSKITLLITVNFMVQLIVDLLSAALIDRLGYRISLLSAHICAATGLLLLTILPDILSPYTGLLISVIIYAIGGGLLEVLVSPIVEACPTDNKEKTMSMLHSFYCWGHVGVVLISTAFFKLFGISSWKTLALIWTFIPVINIFIFIKAPMVVLAGDEENDSGVKKLFSQKSFWIFMMMMLCAGASEQAVSQWASAFAEKGLNVSKAAGDLAGPMFFALMMGLSRFIYGKWGEKLNFDKFMNYSVFLCITAYLIISLSPIPVLGLIGFGLCGLSVGIFWPGTFSKASATVKSGGTSMFALLALAGDLGCSAGPTLVGLISGLFGNSINKGIFAAIIFPFLMLLGLMLCRKHDKI